MRAILQRVRSAGVAIEGKSVSEIGAGLMILLGVTASDTEATADYMAQKCAELRIFSDSDDKMNLSVLDIGGAALVVSQFTLYGDCKKGRRPSYIAAARPEQADPLYERFVASLQKAGVREVKTGVFGADMLVSIENDGPVTLWLDSDVIMPSR